MDDELTRRAALSGLAGVASLGAQKGRAAAPVPTSSAFAFALLAPVRAATVGPIQRAGEKIVDGVALVAGDRVLDKDDPSPAGRGIYVVGASTWSRATDFGVGFPAKAATVVKVEHGSQAGTFTLAPAGEVGAFDQQWNMLHPSSAASISTAGGGNVQFYLDSLRGGAGASLIGFRLPITEALERMAQGKLAERVSWLDFIPAGKHAAILAHSNQDDLTDRLQVMLDEIPSGARIYIPGRVNFEGSLRCGKSITLYGDPGRETFDNSWDRSVGGSQLIHRGDSGDALTFLAPKADNSRTNIVLRDFILRGNRLDERGRSRGRTGRGLVIDGGAGHTTFIRVDMENVHVADAPQHGIDFIGSIYGGSVRNCFVHRCGATGLRAVSNGAPMGEMWLARVRLFHNGEDGVREQDRAGLDWRAGTFLASQISCSENSGPGAIIGGGPFAIDMLQLESNGRGFANKAEARQLVIGWPEAGIVSGRISAMLIDPGAAYRGAHIFISRNARNLKLDGFCSNSLAVEGRHIVREEGAARLDYAGLAAFEGPLRVVDKASDFETIHHVMMIAALDQGQQSVTGNGDAAVWAPRSITHDPLRIYDVSSGRVIAPASGAFRAEVTIGLDGIRPEHRDGRIIFKVGERARVEELGNLGAICSSSGKYTIKASALLLLRQGESLQIGFSVTGGSKTIGVIGGGEHGILTFTSAY